MSLARSLSLRERYARRTGRLSRWKVCKRKHAFSQDRAIRLARKASDETGIPMSAYPCFVCGKWHYGKTPNNRGNRAKSGQ